MAPPPQTLLTESKQLKLSPAADEAIEQLVSNERFPSRSAAVDHAIRMLTGLPEIKYLPLVWTRRANAKAQ